MGTNNPHQCIESFKDALRRAGLEERRADISPGVMAHRLRPRAFLHYLLLTAYYPTAAVAWILGSVNAILYFTLGAGGVVVPAHIWLMLYVDAAALQVGLYFYNRRHNVSPHEKKGSAGVAGSAGLATAQGSYFSFGSGMRSSAAL